MNSRERILIAINHREPDRLPFDLGGTVVTGIQAKAYSRLRDYLGLPKDEYQIGWRMPKDGGMYYDMFAHPLAGPKTEDEIERYQLPDPLDPMRFAGLREAANRVLNEEKRALIIGNISAGIFELLTWTCGYQDAYADWVIRLFPGQLPSELSFRFIVTNNACQGYYSLLYLNH